MMDDIREALIAALQLLVGTSCELLLATNSLRLRFDFRQSPKGRAYIWIDPPWRLVAEGAVLAGSADYPPWNESEDREAYRRLWEAWCAHFLAVDGAVLAEASVGRDYPDLCLRFESGHRIETFGDSRPDWWYYKDRESGAVYSAGPSGIRLEFDRADDPEPRAGLE